MCCLERHKILFIISKDRPKIFLWFVGVLCDVTLCWLIVIPTKLALECWYLFKMWANCEISHLWWAACSGWTSAAARWWRDLCLLYQNVSNVQCDLLPRKSLRQIGTPPAGDWVQSQHWLAPRTRCKLDDFTSLTVPAACQPSVQRAAAPPAPWDKPNYTAHLVIDDYFYLYWDRWELIL